jgi:hypothetical protein
LGQLFNQRQYPSANVLGYHKTRDEAVGIRTLGGGGLLFLFLFFLGNFLLLAFAYFREV